MIIIDSATSRGNQGLAYFSSDIVYLETNGRLTIRKPIKENRAQSVVKVS